MPNTWLIRLYTTAGHAMQKITSVNILSFAKVFGAFGVIVGLIAGVFYGLLIIAASTAGAGRVAVDDHGGALTGLGVGAGLLTMLIMPIFVGLLQFITGLFYGLIINLALWIAGGLELRIEQSRY
jgi:hypothetical protein